MIALLTVAIITTSILSVQQAIRTTLMTAQLQQMYLDSRTMLHFILETSIDTLARTHLKSKNEQTSLDQPWAEPRIWQQDDWKIEARLADAQGYFNLNALNHHQKQPPSLVPPKDQKEPSSPVTLLTERWTSSSEKKRRTGSTLDLLLTLIANAQGSALEPDTEHALREYASFLSQQACEPDTPCGLLHVSQFSKKLAAWPAAREAMLRHTLALPSSDLSVNVNTAQPMVLATLLNVQAEKLAPVMSARTYRSLHDFQRDLHRNGIEVDLTRLGSQLTVRSEYFILETRMTHRELQLQAQHLLHVHEQQGVRVLWEDWGPLD